jgi:ribose 5-phosphate isomerase RpiB
MVDTMKMNQEEYQDHMDKLAKKVAEVLNGQRVEDGISACAACIGFGIVQIPTDKHEKMRAHIDNIIDAIIANMTPPVQQ